MCANFAMILSLHYDRSTHGVFTFLITACAVQLEGRDIRRALIPRIVGLTMVAAMQFVWAYYDIASFFVMRQTRKAAILSSAAAGEAEMATYAIEPYTRCCAGWGMPDLRGNFSNWVCVNTAKYYGLERLSANGVHTYLFPGKTNATFKTGETADP